MTKQLLRQCLETLEALKFAYNGCESDLIRDENIYPAILQIEALGVK